MTSRILPLDRVGIVHRESWLRPLTEATLLLASRIAFQKKSQELQKWRQMPKIVCFFISFTLKGILVQMIGTQSKYKIRNSTLPPTASHVFPCLGPNRPISALFGNSSANTNRAHAVLSYFIVSSAHHLCFLELTCPFPNLFLDIVRAGCEPALHCSRCRPRLCSGWACYCTDRQGLIVFGYHITCGFD